MKLKEIISLIESSQIFLNFKKTEEGKNAFLCAAFLIMDFKDGKNEQSLDYKTEAGENIFIFSVKNDEIQMKQEEILDKTKPLEKISTKIKIETDKLKELVEKELAKNQITKPLEKIIAVLQNGEGQEGEKKTIWNLTCMCAGFLIILIHIDAVSGDILKFEKKSLFDFIKKQ